MDEPIIIEFKTVGADEVGRDMAPLVSSLDSLNQSIQQAAKSFAAMKQATSTGASGMNHAASAARAATGPFQQLADAQDRLNKAMTGGNSTAVKDAMVNLKRRQAAALRADNLLNPKPVDPIQDMIRTARVFIGPTGNMVFNPLVNRMMGSGGPQAARAIQQMLGNAWGAAGAGSAAPASMTPAIGGAVAGGASSSAAAASVSGLAIPAAAAAVALVGLVIAAKMAQDRFAGLGKTMQISGATFGQAARADQLTSYLGMGNVNQVARGFSDAIAQPGFANAVSRGLGINPNNSPWTGDLNDANKLIKAIEAIGDPSKMSDRMARAFARSTGLEDALQLRFASPEVRKLILEQQKKDSSFESIQAATNNQLMLNKAMKDFNTQLAELGIQVLPGITWMLAGLVENMRRSKEGWDNIMNPNVDRRTGLFAPPPQKGQSIDDTVRAQIENTRAQRENTAALSQLTNGVYGAGSGGRNLPIGAIWDAFNANGTGRAIEIGAFSL